MRTRLGSLLIVATLTATLTACGGGGGKITIGKAGDAPATTTGTVDDGSTDDTTTDDGSTDDTTGMTIPDMGTLPTGSEFGDCVELTSALAALASAMSGATIPPETQQQIDDVKSSLPDDVEKDFNTLVEGYKKFGEGDIIEAGRVMSTPEFQAASDRMTAYIEKACAAG